MPLPRPLLIGALAAAAIAVAVAAQAGPVGNKAVPQPARAVELDRYLGLWFELGRYENWFERGQEGVTAEYSRRDDGLIKVVNTGHKGAVDGPVARAVGRAKVVAGSEGAKLRVSFFGPFWADYWVLDHDPDYAWSIVGEPSGRFLWLLSRTAHPSPEVQALIEARAAALGYDLALLRRTKQ